MSYSLAVATTFRCNLQCQYCYNDTHPGVATGYKVRPEPTINEVLIREVTQSLVALGYSQLVLTGGEPMAAPKATISWLHATDDAGLSTNVITNLTLLRPEILDALSAHRSLTCTVSLGAHEAAHHDRLRGKFDVTRRNLETLAARSIRLRLSIVLDAVNIATLADLEAMAIDLGASVHFVPMSPNGVGSLLPLSLTDVSASEWDSAIASCTIPASVYQLTMIRGVLLGSARVHMCHMRTKTQVLDPYGDVCGCFFRSDIRWGNIFTESPHEVFSRIPRNELWDAGCFGEHCIPLHYG